MKKFLSALLTLALLLGLAVPTTTAMAADEGEILVTDDSFVYASNNNDGYRGGDEKHAWYGECGYYGLKPFDYAWEATVDFYVNVETAGLYELIVVHSPGNISSYTSRSFDLYINDEYLGQFDCIPDETNKWLALDEMSIYASLIEGENTVSLRTPSTYKDWNNGSGSGTPNIYALKYSLKMAAAEPTVAPTATPEPTATPVPTATPEPTATPVPTATPEPTVAPTTAPTVAPTEAPKATEAPKPTEAAKPSQKEIVDALYALKDGETLEGKHTLTGVIDSFKYTYSPEYSTIQLTIIVDGMKDKPVVCYKLGGEGIDKVEVGDTITVNGQLKNYKGTFEFNGCTLVSYKKPVVGGEYVIQKGDTLSKIAKAAGVTLQELIEANDIENPNLIRKGAKLIIPTITVKRHIVVKGDTLSKIAKANGCTVADLVDLNKIENPNLIRKGQVIVLPQ